jgi:hypothetical protein
MTIQEQIQEAQRRLREDALSTARHERDRTQQAVQWAIVAAEMAQERYLNMLALTTPTP